MHDYDGQVTTRSKETKELNKIRKNKSKNMDYNSTRDDKNILIRFYSTGDCKKSIRHIATTNYEQENLANETDFYLKKKKKHSRSRSWYTNRRETSIRQINSRLSLARCTNRTRRGKERICGEPSVDPISRTGTRIWLIFRRSFANQPSICESASAILALPGSRRSRLC